MQGNDVEQDVGRSSLGRVLHRSVAPCTSALPVVIRWQSFRANTKYQETMV